uniref:Ribosome recycling factor domain-containing protein n=1 Tax=Eucampia antarctica TaxID=49252 RepID=A0A7S2WDC2_9STRA|mmetsp:Transcript_26815/g.25684  ORF Transcript_26815/g.25684 Transcript_26815/m.25684 type:complete len:325 (+) Transcript_26815:53-1027(+)
MMNKLLRAAVSNPTSRRAPSVIGNNNNARWIGSLNLENKGLLCRYEYGGVIAVDKPLLFQQQQQQRREFGRKAGRMGHHLQNLEEMSHDQERKRAKAKKSGGNNNNQSMMDDKEEEVDMEEEEEMEEDYSLDHGEDELPDTDRVEQHMMRVVESLQASLRSIRGAEPTPDLFDVIPVQAYGTSTSLNSVAQVVIVSPTLATITCFDPSNATAVRDAVRDNMPGMNLNPYVEDGQVTVPIPKASAETRQQLANQLSKLAETSRQRIRKVRRDAQHIIKKAKDGKMEGISKDDAFRVAKTIDTSTENTIALLNSAIDKKKESVLTL